MIKAQIKEHQWIIPKTVSVMEEYLQDTQSVQHGKPVGRRGNCAHVCSLACPQPPTSFPCMQ